MPPPCFRSSYGAVIKFKDYTNWLGKGFHAVVVFGTFMYQEHRILVKSYKCLKCDFSFLKKEELSKNFQCMKWRNPTNVWNLTLVFSKKKSWAHTLLQCMKWKTLQMFEMWLVFSKKEVLSTHITSVHEMKKPYKCLKCDFSFLQKEELNTHIT